MFFSLVEVEAQIAIGISQYGECGSMAPVMSIDNGSVDYSVSYPHRHRPGNRILQPCWNVLAQPRYNCVPSGRLDVSAISSYETTINQIDHTRNKMLLRCVAPHTMQGEQVNRDALVEALQQRARLRHQQLGKRPAMRRQAPLNFRATECARRGGTHQILLGRSPTVQR